MKRFAIIFILLIAAVPVSAQTDSPGFFVQSFKKLEWDLDARSNYPVLDQNNRKAALIKVVIPEVGFDFDVGVMGVVSVRQEVGEVWVYVPEGVRKITIRHQTYGIIRDYEFSCPIESAAVYELRLHVPVQPKVKVVVKDSIVYVPMPVYAKAPLPEKSIGSGEQFNVRKRATQTKWSVLAVTNIPKPSAGLMAMWHPHKFGVYVKAAGKLKRSGVDYYVQDENGHNAGIWNGTFSRLAITTGGTFRCTDWLGVCSGIGYGQNLVWNGNENGTDLYYLGKGLALDLGATLRFGRFTTYIGGNLNFRNILDSVSAAYLEFGVGWAF